MIFDPHKEHNPNFFEQDWEVFSRHQATLKLAEIVKSIVIEKDLVARVSNITLSDISFDVASIVDYAAPLLQMRWSPWRTSIAICRMVHGCYEEDEEFTRFSKSPFDNLPLYPPNVMFLEPEMGRVHGEAVLINEYQKTKQAQYDLFEF